jgi:hypothetical protein
MIGLLCFVLAVLAAPVKSKMRLEAENAVLRHQLTVLRRRLKGRVRLTNNDRWFLVVLYRWFPSILQLLLSSVPRRSSAGTVRRNPVMQEFQELIENYFITGPWTFDRLTSTWREHEERASGSQVTHALNHLAW